MNTDWTIPEHFPRRFLPTGTTLFREGDFGICMYLIVNGRLQVSKQVTVGAEKVLSILGPGQYVGEMSLLTGAKRSATVTALADTEVIEIDQEGFVQLLHDQPRAGLDLMRQMAHRLEQTNEELVLMALEAALVQRSPKRFQRLSQRMRFVAMGSFASEKAAEVLRIASERAASVSQPALVTCLLRLGRTRDALVYLIETANPRDILDLVMPFAGLVQWDISPAVEVQETLVPTVFPEEPSPSFLPP